MSIITLFVALHIILGCVTQMLQGIMPGVVSVTLLKRYSTPWILPKFKYVRLIFLALIVYNSTLLHWKSCFLYFAWYMPSVAWIHIFTSCRFHTGAKLSLFLSLYAIFITVKFHAPITTIVWSVYVLYISCWYNWCLPK